MDYGIAILRRKDKDSPLEAVVYLDHPQINHPTPSAGFWLYKLFRETRRKNAPPGFRLGVLSRSQKRTLKRWFDGA